MKESESKLIDEKVNRLMKDIKDFEKTLPESPDTVLVYFVQL